MKKLKTAVLTWALIACVASGHAQNFGAKYFTFGGKKEQKELKKVFINDFVVRQILRRNATAKAGGGLTADPAYAHMTVDFGGVDKEAYQQVVNEMYELAVQKFKSAGYEVITGDEAKGKTDKELKAFPPSDPENADRIGLHSAIRPKDQLFFTTKSLLANNNYMKLANNLDAIAVQFAFQVEYVSYAKSSGAFVQNASLDAKPYLALSALTTLAVSKGMATVTINPQKCPDDWVGPAGFAQTSKSNVSASWFGSGNISNSSKYTVDVNQDKYLGYVREYLTKEIEASVDTFIQEAGK